MKTRMIWANLLSNDIEKTKSFYTKIGFKLNDDHNQKDLTSFMFGDTNFIINFFTKKRLEDKGNGQIGFWNTQSEVLFSLSADSREEVDQWTEIIKNAGGEIFSEPENFQEGYTFSFSDPDGHKFNVLYWPGM